MLTSPPYSNASKEAHVPFFVVGARLEDHRRIGFELHPEYYALAMQGLDPVDGSLRIECLNLHWFTSIEEAKRTIEAWRREYNALRPHSSLKNQTPNEFARNYNNTETSQVADL